MCTSGAEGSSKSIALNEASALRACMTARRARRPSFRLKVMSFMPSGSKMRCWKTWPRRWPVMPSTTWPAQSRLLPYSHFSPGSNSSGVISAAFEAVMTLGWPFFSARRA